MFIELTDHLRCPADHEESFLVLLPDRLEGRSVRAGRLGCPVCGRTFGVTEGVLDVGGEPAGRVRPGALDPAALTALVGLERPRRLPRGRGGLGAAGARSAPSTPASGWWR
jgi:uncharacterized protein YbaR (Trm112 family)